MSHLQGFEDIRILDSVASELLSYMEAVEVNEEEALFEVGCAACLTCMPAESQASSFVSAWSMGWPGQVCCYLLQWANLSAHHSVLHPRAAQILQAVSRTGRVW